MDSNNDGQVSLQEFLDAFQKQFHAPSSAQRTHLEQMFQLLDEEQTGSINFREYLVGLALMNSKGTEREEVLRIAFDAFDLDSNGLISEDELANVLRRSHPELYKDKVAEIFSEVRCQSIASTSNNQGEGIDFDTF